jgi:hypothetical protein
MERDVSVATTTSVNLTPSSLIADVPGGSTMWDRLRILHVEIWGSDIPTTGLTESPQIQLELLNLGSSTGIGTENAAFLDTGTIGARRAHVSVRPGSLYEAAWLETSDSTTNVLSISTSSANTESITLQATLELRSVVV